MKRINDPFLHNLPYIDIHGYDKEYGVLKVKEFIRDSKKLEYRKVIIIHGKGYGILKSEVQKYLKTDKLVSSYKIDNFNDGITIVEIHK